MNIPGKFLVSSILLSFVLLIVTSSSVSANGDDTTATKPAGQYSLVMYAGGGLSVLRGKAGVSEVVEAKLNRGGLGGSLRVMWHPDHLLRLGFETGRIPFYSYTISDAFYNGKMTVSAVPLLLAWSMPIRKRVNVFVEYGIFLRNSTLDYAGITRSSSNSLGYALAANYVQPISANMGIACEGKWMRATETKDEILNFQLLLVWKFFRW